MVNKINWPGIRCCRLIVYHLWGERNIRIFWQKVVEWQVVGDQIVDRVRACLCGWQNVDLSVDNSRLMESWRVLCSCLKLFTYILYSFCLSCF